VHWQGHTVNQYDISFLDTLVSEHASQNFYLVQQLAVGECLLGLGYGAVEEYGGTVAIASQHMSVYAVEARRDLAPSEPLPMRVLVPILEGLRRPCKSGLWLLMPVEMLRLVRPEGLGILERVTVHLVLWVAHGGGFLLYVDGRMIVEYQRFGSFRAVFLE
jgi:hypothetical protein